MIEFRDEKNMIHSIKDVFSSEAQLSTQIETTGPKQCKICLSEEDTESDPFITPCKCRGSCAFVHFNCLK